MPDPEPMVYEFEDFRLDTGKLLFSRAGERIPLTPKVFETLLLLVKRQGQILAKEELMSAIWPDTMVEENNLNQNISALRRILGESPGEWRYIATVSGKGYRFLPEVRILSGRSPAEPERVRIGVLPFENLGASVDHEYLADGLTEETIASLGQVDPKHIRVIGRTSVMAYKRTLKSLADIGKELDANYLIESSLRAECDRFRITAKLIRVHDQLQIWSASIDSEPKSMLAFQQELSKAIAEQVRLTLSPERLRALERRQTQNAEAYLLYLHGRHFWQQLSPPTTRKAIEYFTRATNIDPQYALAWSGLADCYTAGPVNGDADPHGFWPLARQATTHALNAEPDLAEVQTSVGSLRFWLDWEWDAAEAAYRKAIELDPGYPLGHRMLGVVLSHKGSHYEAQAAIRRARELDPLYVMHQSLSAQFAFAARDYPAAIQFARQAVVVDPGFWIAQFQLAQVYTELGEYGPALAALSNAGKLGVNSKVIALRGYVFARMGRTDDANEVLNTLLSISRGRYVPPYAIALVQAGLGHHDLALQWLERSYSARDVHLIFLTIDPKWDSFRSDESFSRLLERCGFPATR
ncbi:MAG: winged helix-turn-helix domain-containing protein [Terracidiphilus sp.]|nr:winged helix-turn-helix domain-containing protein [Terracidiphilus sp.]